MENGSLNRPFRHLKQLLKEHAIPLEDMPATRIPDDGHQHLSPQQEEALFRHAMADVQPMTSVKTVEPRPQSRPAIHGPSEEEAAIRRLQDLVECGRGYHVADTPEYIEGRGIAVSREIVHQLHQGAFSIQDQIDLHGMHVQEAREAVERFLSSAVRQGLRMVLIIHGRGLSSPREPVLKSNLEQWLNRGAWRKWILAYTSARACDGGAGATYVLLRSRPVSKRRLKRHRLKRWLR
jgi:DNA-nicking Smr family endonuclease